MIVSKHDISSTRIALVGSNERKTGEMTEGRHSVKL